MAQFSQVCLVGPIGNVDGADLIRNRIQDADLDLHGLGLDFYHLSENVHKARRETFGEDNEHGRQWAANLLHTVKHHGYEALVAGAGRMAHAMAPHQAGLLPTV